MNETFLSQRDARIPAPAAPGNSTANEVARDRWAWSLGGARCVSAGRSLRPLHGPSLSRGSARSRLPGFARRTTPADPHRAPPRCAEWWYRAGWWGTSGVVWGMPSPGQLSTRRRGRRVLEERCEFFATLLGSEAACEHAAKKSSDETSAAPQPAPRSLPPRRPHPAAGRSPQPILRLWVVVLAAADEEFDGDFAKNRCLTEHVHQVAAVGLAHRRCSTH